MTRPWRIDDALWLAMLSPLGEESILINGYCRTISTELNSVAGRGENRAPYALAATSRELFA
jgi:hypothetical protein